MNFLFMIVIYWSNSRSKEQPLYLDDDQVELLGAEGNEVYWKEGKID